MKVKNIMFSGAMASILMIGGAYAADLDPTALTTVSFVKGGVNHAITTAESYTDTAIDDLDSATTTLDAGKYLTGVTITDGKISGQTSADLPTASANAKGMAQVDGTTITANNGVIGVASSITTDIANLKTAVGSTETALGTRVTNLETKVGSSSVADQISTALTGYTTTTALNTLLDGKANAATTYSKTEVDDLISNEVSRADLAYDAKGAAADVQGGTTMTVKDVVDLVGDTAVADQISTAVAAEADRAAGVEGTLTNLTTTAQGSLVAAINEVDANADAAKSAADAAQTTANTALANAATAQSGVDALELLVGEDSVAKQIEDKITAAGLGEIVGSTYVTVTSANGKTTISVPNVADTWSN